MQKELTEEIKLIYDLVINGFVLKEKLLKSYGIEKDYLEQLVSNGILQKIDNEQYQISSVDSLYKYGLELLFNKNYHESLMCFEKCHQLKPENMKYCLQLFLAALKQRNYPKAYNMLHTIKQIEPEKYAKDNNLYLYLLNIIYACNEEYKEELVNFDIDDLLLDTCDSNEQIRENLIRKTIVLNDYEYAMDLLNEAMYYEGKYIIKTQIIRELLYHILVSSRIFNRTLLNLAKDRDYEEIIKILENKSKTIYLSSYETYTLMLAREILNISKTRKIPQATVFETKEFYESLKGNNFYLAEKLNNEHAKEKNLRKSRDAVSVLLTRINELILDIEIEELITSNNKPNKQENLNLIKDIQDAEDLAYYIQSEGMTLEVATKRLGLMPEQVLLIKLIYARDYYIEEMYLIGDKLLKEVEKNKNKTSKVVALLKEIRKNRNFYKNRKEVLARKRIIQ